MLTHKNLVTAAIHVRTNLEDGSDTVLLFLPLAHTFGRLCHQAAAYYGSTVALVADPTRVAEALGAVRPTILPAVPRIYEKIHAGVLDRIEGESGPQALARTLGARRRRAARAACAARAGPSHSGSACRSASPTSSSSPR